MRILSSSGESDGGGLRRTRSIDQKAGPVLHEKHSVTSRGQGVDRSTSREYNPSWTMKTELLCWLLWISVGFARSGSGSWEATQFWLTDRWDDGASYTPNFLLENQSYKSVPPVSDCSWMGSRTVRSLETRIRAAAGPHRPGWCGWELQAPGSSPLCRMRLTVNSLQIPCQQGVLKLGSESLCGNVLGTRIVPLPNTRRVPAIFTSKSNSSGQFDVVIHLEECSMSNIQPHLNNNCGGEFGLSVNKPVALVSPGYPNHYPDQKDCLYVLRQEGKTSKEFCFLDLEFLDFSLEASKTCAKDRLSVEGYNGAVFCASRSGTTRIPLLDNQDVRIRFVSDGEGTAKGFRVLASLAECKTPEGSGKQAVASVTSDKPDVNAEVAYDHLSAPLVPGPYPPVFGSGPMAQCCGRIHAGRQFFLTSPGFPVPAGSLGSSCVYTIARLSQQTCRLRLILHHFLLVGCEKHFLEVDGRRICGCQSRTQIRSPFRWNEQFKVITFFRSPLANVIKGGFIIEVVQEECIGGPIPIPVDPIGPPIPQVPVIPGFPMGFDGPGAFWPPPGIGRQVANDVKGSPHAFAAETSAWNVTKSIKRVDPGEDSTVSRQVRFPSDIGVKSVEVASEGEGTGETLGALGLGICGAFSLKDWLARAGAWSETVSSALMQCPLGIFPLAKCRDFRGASGWFASPRYPDHYPNYSRCCYRIFRYPNHCSVQVSMMDFDIEPSPTCSKDYLSLGGSSRYCGHTLASSMLNLEFFGGDYTDIVFVSDASTTGRGFRAFYRQTPCGFPSRGYPPINNPFPAYPGRYPNIPFPIPIGGPYPPSGYPERSAGYPVKESSDFPGYSTTMDPNVEIVTSAPYPPARPSPVVCGGDIRQQHVTLTSRDVAGHKECVFILRRVNQDICGVQVFIESMNLDCSREYIVTGGRTLCGRQQEGQSVSVDFYEEDLEAVYRIADNGLQGNFILHFQQVADCLDLDVTPVARIGKGLIPSSSCVVEVLMPSGMLLAPVLELDPPHDLTCSYEFRRLPGYCSVKLQFHDFTLATNGSCSETYFAINNHKYCGTDLRLTTQVAQFRGPVLELPFNVAKNIAYAQWNISYAQQRCLH